MANVSRVVESQNPWRTFTKRLQFTLERLQPGQFFIINASHPTLERVSQVQPYVQVAIEYDRYLVELSGNTYLGPDFQLDPDQEAHLLFTDWKLAEFGNWQLRAVTAAEAAERLTSAVRDVFGVPRPVLMRIENADSVDLSIPPANVASLVGNHDPGVRTVTEQPVPEMVEVPLATTPEFLARSLQLRLTDLVGHDVFADQDGVFALKVDDVLTFVEPSRLGHPWVRISALVADKLNHSPELLAFVNDVTASMLGTQVYARGGAVYTANDVIASPFAGPAILEAVHVVVDAANYLRPIVTDTFGGRPFYDTPTGGYL